MDPFSESSVIVPMLEGSRNVAVRFTIFHSFSLVFRTQHDSLSCRIGDNDSNKAVQLCN